MKSLRPVMKAVHFKEVLRKANTETVQTGLLDGGATNALGRGSREEISRAELVTVELVTVELASGTTQLYQDMITGTLLTTSAVEPIVPLRGVVDLGHKIKWDRNGCVVMHPVHGKLVCWLRNGCPVVREEHALQLIRDMEDMRRQRKSQPKLAGETVSDEVKIWWKKNFPEVPPNVVAYMTGQQKGKPDGNLVPWNRRKQRQIETARAIVIHLFAGNNASEWRKGWPDGVEVLTLDITESSNQNLHDPNVWGYLNYVVSTKKVLGIVGPPCRIVSRLRNIRPGPNPLGGRLEERFGLKGLTDREQELTDSDSALMLKQLALFQVAHESKSPQHPEIGFLMGSPEDPAKYAGECDAPTFWVSPEVQAIKDRFGVKVVAFDQGQLGHSQTRPTMCLTNLDHVEQMHGARCGKKVGEGLCPALQGRMAQTSSWSAWAPGLKRAIKDSLLLMDTKMDSTTPRAKRFSDSDQWVKHVKQGHRPYRRDCRACILDMAWGPPQ